MMMERVIVRGKLRKYVAIECDCGALIPRSYEYLRIKRCLPCPFCGKIVTWGSRKELRGRIYASSDDYFKLLLFTQEMNRKRGI